MSQFKVGQTVELPPSKEGHIKQGVVKYVGPIHVAEGIWLGVHTNDTTGKNDGSIRGERYFTCPENMGIFIREGPGVTILSEPEPEPAKPTTRSARPKTESSLGKTPSTSSTTPSTTRPVPRQSSGAPAPRSAARQSTTPATTRASTLRAPVRKPSIASTASTTESTTQSTNSRPSLSAASSQSTVKTARDSNTDALKTKIKHLEKQRAEDEETLKDFPKIIEDRDRYQAIYLKLEQKCTALRQEMNEHKERTKTLQDENDRLVKAEQESEIYLDNATMDQQMAELRAEQAEDDLLEIRRLAEARELELETLRAELQAYQTDMSDEDKKEAGYYRLKAENEKLRDALRLLKDYTDENVADYKAQISEMEEDILELDTCKQDKAALQERLTKSESIIVHLQQQVDAANEWEDLVADLSSRNQELEDQIAQQYIVVQDLENLRELNDELELQHIETAEELRADIEAKYLEITQQQQRIIDQSATIFEQEELISKFRDLVLDLQSRMADAESSKTFTEAQAKDAAGKFNEVMDLNRRLRAADISAVGKDITSELRKLKAEQATEMLEVWLETGSKEFGKTSSMQAYLSAKRITSKSVLLQKLLPTSDRHTSYGGGADEASSRLYCAEAIYHLATLASGSESLWSAMSGCSLEDFSFFGPIYDDMVAIEKSLDQGLDALKTDRLNFRELAGTFSRSVKTLDFSLAHFSPVLDAFPEDKTTRSIRSIAANISYLDSTFNVMNGMMEVLQGNTNFDFDEDTLDVLQQFSTPSATFNKNRLAAERLLKTCDDLRNNALYPDFSRQLYPIADKEELLIKAANDAAEWSQNAVKLVTDAFDLDENVPKTINLRQLLGYFFENKMYYLEELGHAIVSWQEHAAVLSNNIEIHRYTAPWVSKAKEVELVRKQEELEAHRLKMIANEHQATILKLHEREKVIETKELEIEHLSAKYREATAKHTIVQSLKDEVAAAHQQVESLQQLLSQQAAELEEHAARSERSEMTPEKLAPVSMGRVEADHTPPSMMPASTMSLVSALDDENKWMRSRRAETQFSVALKKAREVLAMANALPTAYDSTSALFEEGCIEGSSVALEEQVRAEAVQEDARLAAEQAEEERLVHERAAAEKRARDEWQRGEERWILSQIESYSPPLSDPEWNGMSRAEQFSEILRMGEDSPSKVIARVRAPLPSPPRGEARWAVGVKPAQQKMRWTARDCSAATLVADMERELDDFVEEEEEPVGKDQLPLVAGWKMKGWPRLTSGSTAGIGLPTVRRVSERARR